MFPDAVTERGRRHVQELGELSRSGTKTIVLFIIQSDQLTSFLPDFHTDPAFSQTLYDNREDITVIPVGIGWDSELNLLPQVSELPIPWNIYEKHGKDSGVYLFLLHMNSDSELLIGTTLKHTFKKGYYLYVGSAKKALSKRIERHKRTRKNKHWHIDYLREMSSVVQAWPIRIDADIECSLAREIRTISDDEVTHFGSSDCACASHLFYFSQNPTNRLDFQQIVLENRMAKILE